VQTVLDVYLKRTCSRDTSAFSALEVLTIMRYINLLTYLLIYTALSSVLCVL